MVLRGGRGPGATGGVPMGNRRRECERQPSVKTAMCVLCGCGDGGKSRPEGIYVNRDFAIKVKRHSQCSGSLIVLFI